MRAPVSLHRSAWLFSTSELSRPTPPRLLSAICARTFIGSKKDNSDIVRERARSTAEEFSRQAKEKVESVAETAKEAWTDAQGTVAGESQDAKGKFKEKVEKGNYDKTGQD